MQRVSPRKIGWLLVALGLLAAWWWTQPASRTPAGQPGTAQDASPGQAAPAERPSVAADAIPREAFDTLALIERGGPFPHRQDHGVFQNRERLLPARERGWYREYTVRTPGERDRGARRIVTGGDPPSEYYYTADHYRSFRRFDPRSGRLQGGRLR